MQVRASASSEAVIVHRPPVHHWTALLVTELLFILGYPFLSEMRFHTEVARLLAILIFCAALYAVLGRGRITLIAFLIGIPSIAIHIANVAGYQLRFDIAAPILGVVFLVFVSSVFIWSLVSDPTVTADTVAGAISAYLLIGITFGLAFTLLERLIPGSFRNTIEPARKISQQEFVFFSFVTMTTVGYGDIVPWGAHARSLTILEAVTGVMYPVVLIGRLIGMNLNLRKPGDS